MLTIKSMYNGRVLGYAHDYETAERMAEQNKWEAWFIESDMPAFSIEQVQPDTDPRNARGMQVKKRVHG